MNSDTETWEIDVQSSSHREINIQSDGGPVKISFSCQNDDNVHEASSNRVVHSDKHNIVPSDNSANAEPSRSPKEKDKGHYFCNEGIQDDMKKKRVSKSPTGKKVRLCDFYRRSGECKFEDKCYFSHDITSVSSPTKRNGRNEKEYSENTGDRSNEKTKKTIPSDEDHMPLEKNTNTTDNSYLNIRSSNTKPCTFFSTQTGCRFGDRCSFAHYRSVGDAGEEEENEEEEEEEEEEEVEYKRSENLERNEVKNYVQNINMNSKRTCIYFQKPRGCLKGEQCDFTHLLKGERQRNKSPFMETTPLDDTSIATVNIVDKSSTSDSSNLRNPKLCRFFVMPRGCRLKDKCPYQHDNSKLNDANVVVDEKEHLNINNNKLNDANIASDEKEHLNINEQESRHQHSETSMGEKEEVTMEAESGYQYDETHAVNISGSVQKEERIRTKSNSEHEDQDKDKINKMVCRFYLSPKGCFRGEKCTFLHPKKDGDTNVEDYVYLQEREYRQLEKRFSAADNFTLVQSEPSRIYSVIFEPSDPDWGIVVKEFELIIEFPADYPKQLFTITLKDQEIYPERFTSFMNNGIETWIKARQQERDEKDLAFRAFLKWFDRNAEELVLEAGKKVKQLRDAESCGITLISHEDIIYSNPTNGLQEEATPPSEDDQEQSSQANDEENDATMHINEMMSHDNKLANGHAERLSSKVKVGTEMKFTHLEMSENVATIALKNILLVVQCARCKTRSEFNLVSKRKANVTCKKCHVNLSATFHPEIVHQYSHIAGYLHLEGCKAFDVVLLDSIVIVNCLNCSKDHTKKGIAYGKKGEHWCEHCHTKMEIQIMTTKFTQLQKNGEKFLEVKVVAKKPVKYPGIKEGTPLPDKGTCKHYKKSFRWLRFPCCGKLYPCDICHEEGEENDHEMKMATRMICGFCSKEQPSSKERPCVSCKANLTKSRSSHWEGGKGCRNKVTMARTDNKKTAGLGKTISRKKAADA